MTAYLIGDIEITDPEGFGVYIEGVGATLDTFGARVVARAGRTEAPEGTSPNGVLVVVAFESLEKLRAWYQSSGYAELLKIRLAATRSHIFAVEGTDQAPTGGAAGYVIAQITVTDATRYEDYKPGAGAAMTAFGGRFLARGGQTEAVEGGPLGERVIVIEFDSFERAAAWYGSPEYAAPLAIRKRAANATVWITEGL
jgi:uncharacterized protein (DUF1330 family)